ncbi:MAG: DUF859 domain-containing protein [Parvimonas sp.]|uniref:DUF859 family phage minor structural protein n=1 Tax=Parvimonas sp. TaxID=1944660 RepID=UPI0025FA432E|nr:DUF859 family phage minor structural protein [Parvimonas sp.]MCI5997002.1 DUF859 domain-containing protein [Parvimonas sp.]
MALSGNYSDTYRGYTVRTEWEATQNTNGNYSDLNISVYLDCASNYDLYIGSRTHTVTIDGSDYTITKSSISTSGGSSIFLGSTEKRVYHNSDGTCSVSLSTTFDMRANIRGSYVSSIDGGSATVTLDRIPRMSTISDTMDGTRELGTSHTIHIDKYLSGNITHTVWYVIRGDKGSSGWHYIAEKTRDLNLTFVPTAEHINLQPNSSTIFMDIGIDTYKDGVKFGETTYNAGWYMKVPKTAVPQISRIDVVDTVDRSKRLGVFIQNHSVLKFTVHRTGYQGSDIKSTKIYIDGQTLYGYNATSKVIQSSGTLTVKAVVTDTRDMTAEFIKTIRVEPYALPSILKFSGHRLETDEKVVTMLRNFRMSSIADKNTCSWKTERRIIGSSTWTTISTGTDKTLNSSELTYNVNPDYEYEFRLTISDFYTSVSQSFYVYTSFSLIDFHSSGTGLALGKSATRENIFDCDIKASFNKGVEPVIKWTLAKLYNTTKAYDTGNEFKYMKDISGIVHLQGVVKDTSTEWIGQIEKVACRPEKDLLIAVPCTGYKIAVLRIRGVSGDIKIENRSEIETNWISLDGISYKAKE